MDSVINRHRNVANVVVLVFVLFVQVVGLAVQVKRPSDSGGTRLIRVWAVTLVTPLSKGVVHAEESISGVWHGYFDLRHVRSENADLQDRLARMRIQQVRLEEDANQARRLQVLLGFKEQYLSQTLPAQVISTTGSDFSRGVYIDKGTHDGVKQDMPVITPDGIMGKVLRVYPSSSLVLEINDPSSGAGVILEKSRLQGILKGNPNGNGELIIQNIMADEKVEVGERVLTSGGDRIFPKGMPVGVVSRFAHGKDIFLDIWVKPAAQLSRAEEVLVVTKVDERTPQTEPFSPSPGAGDRYSGGETADGGASSQGGCGDDYAGWSEFDRSEAEDHGVGGNRIGGESGADADGAEERGDAGSWASRHNEACSACGGECDRSE